MAPKRPPVGDAPICLTGKYKKVSQREHVLLRPDMYVGSTSPVLEETSFIDATGNLETKPLSVSPAFLQCFEEILMNAADRVSALHESRESAPAIVHRTKTITVDVGVDYVSICNDGDGITTGILEEHGGIHAPELIFGHLLSSSNYDDSKHRLNSGKNGIGSKSVNIFSRSFVVETVDAEAGVKYRQVFERNMSVINPPVLTKFGGKPYTKITYAPDLARFGMDKITPDIEGVFRRRCYEISATSMDPIKVFFNGTKVPVAKFDDYARLYVPDAASRFTAVVNERWRISVGVVSNGGCRFRCISFCNGTATLDGGTHVDHVVDPLVKRLLSHYRKKFKTAALKPSVIKDCLTVVVSAFIENPVYGSQCKNLLRSAPDKFGSTCVLPESLFTKLVKSGLTSAVESFVKTRENKVLNATDGRKSSKVKGIAKLHDAAKAGTRESSSCTLFLCEGDSALTFLLSGLRSADREHCGCFPLKGKLLNVRDASAAQVGANAEIANIKKILGLQQGKTYEDAASRKELRYGRVVLAADSDADGSHIAGLLLNLFDCFWPSLVGVGFVQNMLTPVVRASGPRGVTKLFYNEFEYAEWQRTLPRTHAHGWKIRFLKGLGSSSAKESKEYFENFSSSLVTFKRDDDSLNSMQLAFSKDRANDRKAWLSSYDKSEILLNTQRQVSLSEFVHLELKHFSESDVRRSIPSAIDGLKTSQRKILFGCFSKQSLNSSEMKVAQLCGYVADKSCYHHGEVSLSSAITSMAQDFVGSNNVNLLLPKGQLGSRLQGGKDAASPRYTFVQLNPLTSLIYRREDLPILEYTEDDGVQTEPVFYVPIIPMALVNGASGIGSGFSTSVLKYNPVDLIENLKRRLTSSDPTKQLIPWYRGFRGSISESVQSDSFKTVGIFDVHGSDVHITELPIGTWTTTYKAFLDGLVEKKMVVASYTEKCTDVDVDINVKLLDSCRADEVDIATLLKLSSTLRTSNMHLYSASNRIKKFVSVEEVEDEHFRARFEAYVLRKQYVLKVLAHELSLLESKLKFVESKLAGTIVIDNVSFDQALVKLEKAGLPKLGSRFDDVDKSYAYVTSLNMFDVTSERVCKLRKEVEAKKCKLSLIEKTSVPEMWMGELDELANMLMKRST